MLGNLVTAGNIYNHVRSCMLQVMLRRPMAEWTAMEGGRHIDTCTFIQGCMRSLVTFQNRYPGFLEEVWVIAQRPVWGERLRGFLTDDRRTMDEAS